MNTREHQLSAIREEFPVLAGQAYLNTGTAGPLPRRTAEAIVRQIEEELRDGRADQAAIFERYFPLQQELRARFARLLGAQADEVSLTHHTTEGMNVAVWGLNWQRGDEIVTTSHEHEGGLLPVYAAARRLGLTLRLVDLGTGDGDIAGAVARALSPRTKLVVVSHVSYKTGTVLPLAEIASAVHAIGAFLAVDGAQAAGVVPVDVQAQAADCYAVSGQKWLCGPEGVGALYVRRDRISELSPTFVGHLSMRDYKAIDLSGYFMPAPGARRYDGGAVNWPGLRGMCESLRFLEDTVGYGWVFERCKIMTQRARAMISELPGVRLLSPNGHVGLTAFSLPGLALQPTVQTLAKRGVTIRAIHEPDGLRVSTGFFTNEGDIARLCEELMRLREGHIS